MKARGFSLIECLTALALGFFVICASLEFFVFAEKLFFKLKSNEETGQGVLAALDKMRIDLHHAGQGLVPALRLGLVEAVEVSANILTVRRAGRIHVLSGDARSGDGRLFLTALGDLRPGRRICIWDASGGEVRDIAAVETATRSIVLGAPLEGDYGRSSATVALLETTVLFLDEGSGILRRRVNLSSAQPLLDDAGSVDFRYDPERNLAVIRLQVPSQGGRAHELSVFPKNPAAAR